jgi:hypothetical protein
MLTEKDVVSLKDIFAIPRCGMVTALTLGIF